MTIECIKLEIEKLDEVLKTNPDPQIRRKRFNLKRKIQRMIEEKGPSAASVRASINKHLKSIRKTDYI